MAIVVLKINVMPTENFHQYAFLEARVKTTDITCIGSAFFANTSP